MLVRCTFLPRAECGTKRQCKSLGVVSGPFKEGTVEYQFVDFLVKVLSDGEAAKRFFEDQCATAPVTGELAALYTGVQRLTPGAETVNACRDNANAAEDLLG